jgi:hypothetical protein
MPARHNGTGKAFFDAHGREIRPGGLIGFDAPAKEDHQPEPEATSSKDAAKVETTKTPDQTSQAPKVERTEAPESAAGKTSSAKK